MSKVIPFERPSRISVLIGLINTEVNPETQSLTTKNLAPEELEKIKRDVFRLRNTQIGVRILQERQRLITTLTNIS